MALTSSSKALSARIIILADIAAALLAAFLFAPCVKVVSVTGRTDSGKMLKLYSRRALNGFVISYTHSVNKGRIHDYYACRTTGRADMFILEKSVFVSYGAGIPEPEELAGCTFTATETGYVLGNMNRRLTGFLLAVGVVAEHSISIDGGEELFLKDLFPVQTSLAFRIRRVSVADYITHTKEVK